MDTRWRPERFRRRRHDHALTTRLAAGLVPLVLTICACSSTDDAATTTTFAPPLTNPPLPTSPTTDASPATSTSDTVVASTDAPASTTTATTTTIAEVTTVTSVEETPQATQPGDPDWTAIVQGLYNQIEDVNADPTIERIGEFCVSVSSPCRDQQGAQVEALVRDGWKVVDPVPASVINASLVSTVDDKAPTKSALVVLDVLIKGQEGLLGTIVDSSGDILFDVTAETTENSRVTWFIRMGSDGQWKLFEIR